jgi:hypothetical protein
LTEAEKRIPARPPREPPGRSVICQVLAACAQADQLDPAAGQLPHLTHLMRRHPRLGQASHPQQVRQVRRVAHIVFDPPVSEPLHAQRVRQVNLRASRSQRDRRPVPPIPCLPAPTSVCVSAGAI